MLLLSRLEAVLLLCFVVMVLALSSRRLMLGIYAMFKYFGHLDFGSGHLKHIGSVAQGRRQDGVNDVKGTNNGGQFPSKDGKTATERLSD